MTTQLITASDTGRRPQNFAVPERLPQTSYESLAPELRLLADEILKVSSAGLGGPYNAEMRHRLLE